MATLPKELSPERCHQLREGSILRLMVNLLHEHTIELQNKPEADFNIDLFLMDFNRKAELRARLSNQLRTIVKHTAKNDDELKILDFLAALRMYIQELYSIIDGWKAITEDADTLRECTDRLTKLAGEVKEAIEGLETFTADDTYRPFFEQFGGVFVIVDYLRAQTRFNANCHQFKSDQIDLTPLHRVANDSKLVLRDAVSIMTNLGPDSSDWDIDLRLFLGESRSLHDIMVGIAEDADVDGHLEFVEDYCYLLHRLFYTGNSFVPPGVLPSTSLLKDCGVIKCLTKFGMNIKEPKTLYYVLLALETSLSLELDDQNVLEFVSIDGSVDMLIDVLAPSKEKDEDLENAKWYEKQRKQSTMVLYFMNRHLSTQDRLDGRLLAIYESRDFAAILVHYFNQIPSVDESLQITQLSISFRYGYLGLLRSILSNSEDQRRKFTEVLNGKELLKRLESSDDDYFAQSSKRIGELFE